MSMAPLRSSDSPGLQRGHEVRHSGSDTAPLPRRRRGATQSRQPASLQACRTTSRL